MTTRATPLPLKRSDSSTVKVNPHQPVVILGGFLITDEAYQPLIDWLATTQGIDASVVHASRSDWLLTSWAFGWKRLLKRVDQAVLAAKARSGSSRVTLIGHSSGGVMLRLYLAEAALDGASLNGRQHCNRLICLGSPHQALRATPLRAMVDRLLPGCACASDVDYISVAGRLNLQSTAASAFARRSAPGNYERICGDAQAAGDGLVPVSSAWLKGSRLIELEDTAHGGFFGQPWYGSAERISQWWAMAQGATP